MKLCVDLFCGLGGWAEGFLAENYWVVGFDIERHDYGTGVYPGDFVMQDVLTLHGKQFKDAACIVASPPCQAYSYRAMPWKRAKALPPPDNSLFEACFRIQREASEAAGHHIPLVVENVCGAQKWVGRAEWHFGSYYLWGDVPALMPAAIKSEKKTDMPPVPLGTMYRETGASSKAHITGTKREGFRFDGSGKSFQSTCVEAGRKVPGIKLSDVGFNVAAAQRYREATKFSQSGDAWFDGKPRDKMLGDRGPAAFSSRSDSRKAASAMIAKIPFPLANHIARCFA